MHLCLSPLSRAVTRLSFLVLRLFSHLYLSLLCALSLSRLFTRLCVCALCSCIADTMNQGTLYRLSAPLPPLHVRVWDPQGEEKQHPRQPINRQRQRPPQGLVLSDISSSWSCRCFPFFALCGCSFYGLFFPLRFRPSAASVLHAR